MAMNKVRFRAQLEVSIYVKFLGIGKTQMFHHQFPDILTGLNTPKTNYSNVLGEGQWRLGNVGHVNYHFELID